VEHYILDEHHRPVKADLMEWAVWFEEVSNRRVDRTEFTDGTAVSTVFLGDTGPRFETMVFGGTHDGEEMHTYSWEDAVAAHAEYVRLCNG
jgi:hypothetical protein